jgi:hypothetical protein
MYVVCMYVHLFLRCCKHVLVVLLLQIRWGYKGECENVSHVFQV